jgi:hypothetical protein
MAASELGEHRLLSTFEPRVSECLEFYAVTSAGTLQTREISRFMERTGPLWWEHVTAMTRQKFWDKASRTLVARHVETFSQGSLRPDDEVEARHQILHGHRPRAGQDVEYGFVDILEVSRPDDSEVLARFVAHSVWLEFDAQGFRVATSAPADLNYPDVALPAIPPLPSLTESTSAGEFRWTHRESDVNGHVSLLSYLERAENTHTDARDAAPPGSMRAWYLRPFTAGETARLMLDVTNGRSLVGFLGVQGQRPRALVEIGSEPSPLDLASSSA